MTDKEIREDLKAIKSNAEYGYANARDVLKLLAIVEKLQERKGEPLMATESPAKTREELVYLRATDGRIMIHPSKGYPLEEYIKIGGWERVRVTPWEDK